MLRGRMGEMFLGRMDARGREGCSSGTQLPHTHTSRLSHHLGQHSLPRCAAPHLEPPTRSSQVAEAGSLPVPCAPTKDGGLGTARAGGRELSQPTDLSPCHGDGTVPGPISCQGSLRQDTTTALFSLISPLLLI